MHLPLTLLLALALCHPQDSTQAQPFETELKAIASGDAEQQAKALARIWADHIGKPSKRNAQVIHAITPFLENSDPDLRGLACMALSKVGATPDVFLPLLKDKNPGVRRRAAEAHFETGGPLTKARFILADEDPNVRAHAACAYVEHGGQPSEVVFLFDDTSSDVRRRVATIYLKTNGNPRSALELLTDSDASVRRSVSVELIKRGVVNPVFSLLEDPDEDVRAEVIRSLVVHARDPEHYRLALKSTHNDVRSQAALALLARREIALLEVLPHMVDDNYENLTELQGTADQAQRRMIQPLLRKWLKGENEFHHGTAERTLNQWGIATETLKAAREGIAHPDLEVRIATVRRLTGQPLDLEPLVPAIAGALAEKGGDELANYVCILALDHKLQGLVPALRPYVTEASPLGQDSQMWIARTVAELDPKDMDSIDVLAKLMDSEQKSVRIAAARHLLQLELKPPRIFRIMKWIKKGVARPPNSMTGMWCRSMLARNGKAILPTIKAWLADDTNLPLQAATIDVAGQILLDRPQTDEQRAQIELALESVLPQFARLLGSKNSEVQRGAAMFLGQARSQFGDRKLDWPHLDSRTLTAIATMPSPGMKHFATGLLAFYESDPPARRLELLKQLQQDQLPAIRARAYLATLKIPGTDHESVIPDLIGMFDQLDSDTQGLTLRELADTGISLEFALPKLLDILDGDEVRGLEYSFSRVGPAAIPGLTKRLKDVRPHVRLQAAEALGLVGGADSAAALLQSLDDRGSRRQALKALLKFDRLPSESAPRLIRIVASEMDKPSSTECDIAIQLLGRIGPAASPAVALLARQDYELTENYTGGGPDVIPERAALMADALARIEPKRDVGLMGFRKILRATTTGRSWLYEQGGADKSSGYEMAIDSIVKLGDRCESLVPRLVEIAEPPGQLIHPSYRGLAAYALSRLQPEKAEYWKAVGKRMYDRLGKYSAGRRAVARRFEFDTE